MLKEQQISSIIVMKDSNILNQLDSQLALIIVIMKTHFTDSTTYADGKLCDAKK